jgi:uncharacterized protein YrzB (UPF0473 family)
MTSNNGDPDGEGVERGPLELRETLFVKTKEGAELPFEVVGVLEDPDDGSSYAVLMHEGEDEDDQEFIVTDLDGNLLEDDTLAQEILDDFIEFAEEAGDEGV